MSGWKKIVSHTAIYGLSSIIGRAINWGLTPLYANYFTPGEFGVFSDLYSLSFYPLILLSFGLETAFFHFSALENEGEKAYAHSFICVATFSLIFAATGLLLSEELAALLGYANRPECVRLLIGIITMDSLAALPMAKLRYDEKPRSYVSVSLANIFFTLVLNFYFILVLNGTITHVFLANFIASAIRLGMALRKNLPQNLFSIHPKTIQTFLSYGKWIMFAGLAGAINEAIDRNLLPRLWPDGALYKGRAFSGDELNGVYAANYKIGMFIALVTQAYRYAAEPLFFRKAREKHSFIFFAEAFHYFVTVCWVAFLFVGVFSYEIVSFNGFGLFRKSLLPPEYYIGLEAVPLILLANVFLGAYLNLAAWFKVTGKTRYGLYCALVGAVFTLSINIFLIPYWGYMACAAATALCYFATCCVCYLWGQKFYPVPYRFGRVFAYGLLALAAVYGLTGLPLETPYLFGIKTFICLSLISALFFYEKRFPFKAAAPKETI